MENTKTGIELIAEIRYLLMWKHSTSLKQWKPTPINTALLFKMKKTFVVKSLNWKDQLKEAQQKQREVCCKALADSPTASNHDKIKVLTAGIPPKYSEALESSPKEQKCYRCFDWKECHQFGCQKPEQKKEQTEEHDDCEFFLVTDIAVYACEHDHIQIGDQEYAPITRKQTHNP